MTLLFILLSAAFFMFGHQEAATFLATLTIPVAIIEAARIIKDSFFAHLMIQGITNQKKREKQ